MKIGVVTNFYPPEAMGGAEIYAFDLCAELGRQGFDVEVFTSTGGRPRIERNSNVTVHFFSTIPPVARALSNLLGYNFNPWSTGLIRALVRARCDLVHVHNINSSIMLYPLLTALKLPTVCHVHDHWPVCYRGFLFDTWNGTPCFSARPSCCFNPGFRIVGRFNLAARRRLLDKFESRVDAFIAPSYHMRDTLVARQFTTADKIDVIRLGVDFANLPNTDGPRQYKFVFAGRLVDYKNPEIVAKILARGHLRNAHFRILGRGPEEANLRAAFSSTGVRLNEGMRNLTPTKGSETVGVTMGWVPARRDVLVEISTARGLLVPSKVAENSPLVIYEALACGSPVICANLGGGQELVRDSGAGYVVPSDDVPGWQHALEELCDDDVFYRLSSMALTFAQRELRIEHSARAVAKLYDRIAD